MNAIDTNVLIYACDSAAGEKHVRAAALLDRLSDGVLPWQVACEFIASSRKLQGRGFTSDDAWAVLAEWLRAFPILLPTRAVLDRARSLMNRIGMSFWDALIAAACLEAGVNKLYSEDLPGGTIEGLDIANPFA